MRFSGFHMETKWHSDEIMRLQHYNLLVDASCKLPPKLEAFMLDLETAPQPPPPLGWGVVTGVFEEAFEVRGMTNAQHSTNHSATAEGEIFNERQRSRPISLRAHGSRWIHICMEALLVAADFTTVKTVRDRTDITKFDHCLPHLKGSDAGKSGTYPVSSYWVFCHKACHRRDTNRP